jgi:hypothetical protein
VAQNLSFPAKLWSGFNHIKNFVKGRLVVRSAPVRAPIADQRQNALPRISESIQQRICRRKPDHVRRNRQQSGKTRLHKAAHPAHFAAGFATLAPANSAVSSGKRSTPIGRTPALLCRPWRHAARPTVYLIDCQKNSRGWMTWDGRSPKSRTPVWLMEIEE